MDKIILHLGSKACSSETDMNGRYWSGWTTSTGLYSLMLAFTKFMEIFKIVF